MKSVTISHGRRTVAPNESEQVFEKTVASRFVVHHASCDRIFLKRTLHTLLMFAGFQIVPCSLDAQTTLARNHSPVSGDQGFETLTAFQCEPRGIAVLLSAAFDLKEDLSFGFVAFDFSFNGFVETMKKERAHGKNDPEYGSLGEIENINGWAVWGYAQAIIIGWLIVFLHNAEASNGAKRNLER